MPKEKCNCKGSFCERCASQIAEDKMCPSCFQSEEDYARCGNGFCKDCCHLCAKNNNGCPWDSK